MTPIGEKLQGAIVALHGDAGQRRKTIVEQAGALGVGAQGGVFGVDFAGGELEIEEAHGGVDEPAGKQQRQEPGLHAAVSRTVGARRRFMASLRSRSASTCGRETSCCPYQARSKPATLAAKSSRASG